ncbi:hypothetical protein HN643_00575 [Candidatus Falkowbacteria bacterium]|jgi:hypothetical protein|nr:hypothetical protein [Candidatus Falkowbacteria bacterium]MBT5503351.1 hypothetical protein [Candidatus Falkowbacteria bacterium]MBT6573681.1 hypothetical protein [Candidatus Falkowbacteria bacterium]MBT7500152.1 hypothetical protein [Candidatus Falkowbacteria bacterium]
MISSEQNLTERSLHANFTEVQQAHFDRLMSELEVISGGLGFAELKVKAEEGGKGALQVLRDYIVKKEQIVRFIETKDPLPEVKVDDLVVYLDTAGNGEVGVVEDIDNGVHKVNTGRELLLFREQIIKLQGDYAKDEEFPMETDSIKVGVRVFEKGMKVRYKFDDSVFIIQGFSYSKFADAVRIILTRKADTMCLYLNQVAERYEIVEENEA